MTLIALLWVLVHAAILIVVVYVVLKFLAEFAGFTLPEKAVRAIWFIVGLVILIWVLSLLYGAGTPFLIPMPAT
jgi:hypothetical protein